MLLRNKAMQAKHRSTALYYRLILAAAGFYFLLAWYKAEYFNSTILIEFGMEGVEPTMRITHLVYSQTLNRTRSSHS